MLQLPFTVPEENERSKQEVTVSLAKEISVGAAVVSVLSEVVGNKKKKRS